MHTELSVGAEIASILQQLFFQGRLAPDLDWTIESICAVYLIGLSIG
jgi:hypothetical protein